MKTRQWHIQELQDGRLSPSKAREVGQYIRDLEAACRHLASACGCLQMEDGAPGCGNPPCISCVIINTLGGPKDA